MGNGSSTNNENLWTDVSKTDKLLTPTCTLSKEELQAEWALFLQMPFLTDELRQKMVKFKAKVQWPLLCKSQRTIAKRLSEDAKISEKMDFLYEAAALVQASICIHERVTNVNIAGTDYAECKRRMKLLEKDLYTGRQRVPGQCPDETAIVLALDEYISCSWLLNCIRDDFRKLSSVHKWGLCLYFEYMTATNIAQSFADRAVENLFLPASREFYRCALHFFETDALVEALQTVTSEIEYQEFSAKIHGRPLPGPVAPENIKAIRDQFSEIMNDLPHVIRDDMGQISPEAMENIILFIQTLRLNCADVLHSGNSGFIVQPKRGHRSNVSDIIFSSSQIEEDSAVDKKAVGDEKVKPPSPAVQEQVVAKPKVLAGASSTKPNSKIADLQAQLNLNPAMFMGTQQQPKALALKKSKGLMSEDKVEAMKLMPAQSLAVDSKKHTKIISESVSETPSESKLEHANLDRPMRAATRRPRKAPVAAFSIAEESQLL